MKMLKQTTTNIQPEDTCYSVDYNDLISRSNVSSGSCSASDWLRNTTTVTSINGVYWPSNTITTTGNPHEIKSGFYSVSKKDPLMAIGFIEKVEELGFEKLDSGSLIDMRILDIFNHIAAITLGKNRWFFKSLETKWLSDFTMCINLGDPECQICVSDNFLDVQRDDLIEDIKEIFKKYDIGITINWKIS